MTIGYIQTEEEKVAWLNVYGLAGPDWYDAEVLKLRADTTLTAFEFRQKLEELNARRAAFLAQQVASTKPVPVATMGSVQGVNSANDTLPWWVLPFGALAALLVLLTALWPSEKSSESV